MCSTLNLAKSENDSIERGGEGSIINNNNNNHRKSYKVHPDVEDMEQQPESSVTNFDDFNYREFKKDENNLLKYDQKILQGTNAGFDGYKQSSSNQIINVQPLNSHIQNLPESTLVTHNSRIRPKNPENIKMEYPSDVMKNLPENGDNSVVSSVKTTVPETTVFFKIYHDNKPNGNSFKTNYQSGIFNEDTEENVPDQSAAAQPVSIPALPNNIATTPHTNYLVKQTNNVHSIEDNSYVHSKMLVPGKDKNHFTFIHQQTPVVVENYGKLSSQSINQETQEQGDESIIESGGQKYRISPPKNQLNAIHYQNDFEPKRLPKTSFQTSSLDNSGASSSGQKVFGHFAAPVYVTGTTVPPVNLHDKDSSYSSSLAAGTKILAVKHVSYEKNGIPHNHYSLGKSENYKIIPENNSEQSIIGTANNNVPLTSEKKQEQQLYYVTRPNDHPNIIEPTSQSQFKISVTEKPVPDQIIKTIAFRDQVPITPEDYIKKYQKDVAEIQASWKTLNQLGPTTTTVPLGYQKKLNTLPLISEPVNSFHFEINPFIDVDQINQISFDHKKALEGSTSFDINHAIGNVKRERTKSTRFSPSIENNQRLKTNEENNPQETNASQLLYTLPPKYKIQPQSAIFKNNDHREPDGSHSNIDHSMTSPTANINHGYYKPQTPHSIFIQNQNENDQVIKLLNGNKFDSSFTRLKPSAEIVGYADYYKGGGIPHAELKTHVKYSVMPTTKQNHHRNNYLNSDNYHQESMKTQKYLIHSRPNQILMPQTETVNIDSFPVRNRKPNKMLLKSESIPNVQNFGQKIIPVLIRKPKNRREIKSSPNEKLISSNNKMEKNIKYKFFGNDFNEKENLKPQNEFSVSASYKINKTFHVK